MAALLSFLGACGIIVPCMSQVFYEGPISKAGSGDIGVIVGFLSAIGLYTVSRSIEKKFTGERIA